MNTRNKSDKPQYAVKDGPKIKTLDLRLSVTQHDLEEAVKRAFALAKSAGQELDLTFSCATS